MIVFAKKIVVANNSDYDSNGVIYVNWNEGYASRGNQEDTLSILNVRGDSDMIIMYAAAITLGYEGKIGGAFTFLDKRVPDGQDIVNFSENQLADAEEDYGSGFPVVYGLKIDGKWVYKSDIFDDFMEFFNSSQSN